MSQVTGEVSVDNPPPFFGSVMPENKIRCFIPGDKVPQFQPLVETRKYSDCKWKSIQIFPAFSEYQLRVKNIQSV